MSYNLLEKQWIPVLWTNGNVTRVGIKEALTQAEHIRQIAASNPMDRVAIFRFLLALLYWCRGNPPATADTASEEPFPIDWLSRLDANRKCFNLLGDGKRFYQYREQGGKLLAVNYLIHEIPVGTNFNHFRHSVDGTKGLCPACCALGLLRLPMFSTQGGKGKSPGINAKPPIYVIPLGETLAETLRLSWRQASNLGTPAWEKPDVPLPGMGEVPLLTGLTWLPRRVWLSEPQESLTHCISCGRLDNIILSSVFAGKGSTKTGEDTRRDWHDPHVIYEQRQNGEMPLYWADVVRSADAGAGQWARIMAGLLRNPRTERTRAWIVGFSSDQNKYIEASEMVLPWEVSDASIEKLIRWQNSNYNLKRKLKQLDEKLSREHVEKTAALDAIRSHVEGIVSAKAEELLSGDNAVWKQAAGEYRPMMQMIARSFAPGVTAAAIKRRREIGNMLPQIEQMPPVAKRPRGKSESVNESNSY